MSFPRYNSYRESGIEWLGDVPAHWGIVPFKHVIERIEAGTSVNAVDTPAADGERGVLKTSCVYSGEFNPAENKAILPEEYDRASCPLRAGALIVSRMNTPDLVGAAGLVRAEAEELYLPDRLWQLHIKNCEAAFVHFWTASVAYRCQVKMSCSGTSSSMQNLAQDQLLTFWFPNPPRREQAEIVRFLNRETTKIDALADEQQRLIELLKEKRQAAISYAVTKGLDPKALMRRTEIEGLGEVPTHWEVKRIKHLSTLITKGTTPTTIGAEFADTGVRFIKAENITDGRVSKEPEFFISSETHRLMERSNLQDLDVLVVIAGATTGKSAVITADFLPANTNQAVAFVRCRDTQTAAFVNFWLSTAFVQERVKLTSVQSAQPNLSMEDLGNMPIPVPPSEEQTQILTYLRAELARLDALTSEATKAIELLAERRAALISAAVTGKIDVRGSVEAELPAPEVVAA